MTKSLNSLFLILTITLGIICSLNATPGSRWQDPSAKLYPYSGEAQPLIRDSYEARADSAHGFDVQKYVITLAIDQQAHTISGNVVATVLATSNLPSIAYNLESLSVSSVLVNNSPVTFTHTNGIITIPVNASSGQTFTTKVIYSGAPVLTPNGYHIGMIFSNNTVFTISDPDASRYWWPCYDHPWDKAIVDLIITMRSDWKVAANGLRQNIVDNGNGTSTTTWLGQHPLTTYLACITCGPYQEIDQTALSGSLPIKNFVPQSMYNNALLDLADLPAMINYFSAIFGTYPFEKYGNSVVTMSTYGAMEHQTMTTLGNYIINGQGTYELVIAHELAHQWYGNAVSFLTFKDVWLSEGFATYSELLWTDKVFGWPSAAAYAGSAYHDYYINWENSYGTAARIYDPAFMEYFNPPSYEKAASVLHMLRLKIGDAHFFTLLHNWFETYKHGNAITSEFQAMAENISGMDLDQFFAQWIYGTGIPSLEYGVFSRSGTQNGSKVIAKTSSPTATSFNIDVPFRFTNQAASDSLLVHAASDWTTTLGSGSFIPTDYAANYNHWTLLRGTTEVKTTLSECLPSNSTILLSWNAPTLPGTFSYRVYRRSQGQTGWTLIHTTQPNILSYLDNTVSNGTTYSYRVRAVDNDGYELLGANVLEGTPIAFSFANDLLVVDETRDGTGTAISPDDAMVDNFYATCLNPIVFDTWDVATSGMPTLTQLGTYKVILWHADDFSQNMLGDFQPILGGYMLGGGKVVLSGWKTSSTLTQTFWDRFANGITPTYDNAAVLLEADSNIYPDLSVDVMKLTPSWNGALPMIYTFPGVVNPIYTAVMSSQSPNNGSPVAFHNTANGNLTFFGLPLYFMEQEDVRPMLQSMISGLLDPTDNDDPMPPPQALLYAYPNPFNRSMTIKFMLPHSAAPRIEIFNLRGQIVRSYSPGILSPGPLHEINFDGKDQQGNPLASGVYTIRYSFEGTKLIHRISLIK